MSNPLVNSKATAQQPDLSALYQSFLKNPMEFLLRSKLNIPKELAGNPQAMVQHLIDTNQVPEQVKSQIAALMPKR